MTTTRTRSDGTIRRRGDGWQVSLFTGYDPLTGKRVYLTQVYRLLSLARPDPASRRMVGERIASDGQGAIVGT